MHELTFDPLSEEFARDPYAAYAQLRELDEPYFYAPMNAWLLARYDDVEAAARSPDLVRSREGFMSADEIAERTREANLHDMPNHARFVQFSMLETDGEVHRRLRMLVLREFSRHFVERHRRMIQGYVDKLLDELLQRGEIDFVEDLASRVPGHIIGNVIGVPDEDCPQLKRWSEDVVQFFDVGRTAEHKALAERATTEFYHYLLDLIQQRRRVPRTDLLTRLIEAKDSGEIDETELISTCMLILMAGHGSTIDVLGTGMYALLSNPSELARLRDEPSLVHTAVQEMFRYDSPLPYFHRYADREVEVAGRRWQTGTKFGLLYGSANRDEAAFPGADEFDAGRTPNRHVAFGRGAHLCLGNNLSRLDMEIIFNSLLSRTSTIELVGDEPTFRAGLSSRVLVSLPLRLQGR